MNDDNFFKPLLKKEEIYDRVRKLCSEILFKMGREPAPPDFQLKAGKPVKQLKVSF